VKEGMAKAENESRGRLTAVQDRTDISLDLLSNDSLNNLSLSPLSPSSRLIASSTTSMASLLAMTDQRHGASAFANSHRGYQSARTIPPRWIHTLFTMLCDHPVQNLTAQALFAIASHEERGGLGQKEYRTPI
jgi:hypothetical protein